MGQQNAIAAVGYARRSTDKQERSIPDQQAHVERWAAENGCRVLRWYVDDAISGTSTKGRDAFESMIREAENGRDFNAVLCYDMSRFSRGGTNETGYYLHRLTLAGVKAVFTAEGIPEGDEGELLQGVKSWQARQFSAKLARDVIRGQLSSLKQNHCVQGGRAPFGYDRRYLAADGTVLRIIRYLADGRKREFDSQGRHVRLIAREERPGKTKYDVVRLVPGEPEHVVIVREIFGRCIEVDPVAKTETMYLPADALACLEADAIRRVNNGSLRLPEQLRKKIEIWLDCFSQGIMVYRVTNENDGHAG